MSSCFFDFFCHFLANFSERPGILAFRVKIRTNPGTIGKIRPKVANMFFEKTTTDFVLENEDCFVFDKEDCLVPNNEDCFVFDKQDCLVFDNDDCWSSTTTTKKVYLRRIRNPIN